MCIYQRTPGKMLREYVPCQHQNKFQFFWLLSACEACRRNIFILVTVESTNNDPTSTLHRKFLSFNLTHMNIKNCAVIKCNSAHAGTTSQTVTQIIKLQYGNVWLIKRTHPANWYKLSIPYAYLAYNTNHIAGYTDRCDRLCNLLLM